MGIVVKDGKQITYEQEHEYWQQFFQLYAFGDMKDFPPVQLPEGVKTGTETVKEAEKK